MGRNLIQRGGLASSPTPTNQLNRRMVARFLFAPTPGDPPPCPPLLNPKGKTGDGTPVPPIQYVVHGDFSSFKFDGGTLPGIARFFGE